MQNITPCKRRRTSLLILTVHRVPIVTELYNKKKEEVSLLFFLRESHVILRRSVIENGCCPYLYHRMPQKHYLLLSAKRIQDQK